MNSSAYFWVILAYLLALVGVGLRTSRKVSTQEDFSVAGRSLNTFVLFATLLATRIGTGSIFGNAEKTYRVGVAALILPLGSLFGIAVLTLLAGRVRGLRQITVQDLLGSSIPSAGSNPGGDHFGDCLYHHRLLSVAGDGRCSQLGSTQSATATGRFFW